MISAVELHSGGAGGFYPTFSRPPTTNDQYTTQMSGTEFARPKPKSINNNIVSSLNVLSASASSPTHKYSHHHEQNGPVNLAVNHQSQSRQSSSEKEHSEKEIDVVGLGNSSSSPMNNVPISFATTSSSRISSSYPAGLGSNAYQALNYSFYGNRYR